MIKLETIKAIAFWIFVAIASTIITILSKVG